MTSSQEHQKVEMQTTAQSLAREFSQAIRSRLSPLEMEAVLKRNQVESTPNICHTHDFCDANMVLHSVFLQHGMDIADEGGMDRWGELWNQTWNLAKTVGFH